MTPPKNGTTGPPAVEGRSKRIWPRDDGTCVVELIPSLRSHTFDRDELVPATARLRLDFYEHAARALHAAGMRTVFRERLGETTYLADSCRPRLSRSSSKTGP